MSRESIGINFLWKQVSIGKGKIRSNNSKSSKILRKFLDFKSVLIISTYNNIIIIIITHNLLYNVIFTVHPLNKYY